MRSNFKGCNASYTINGNFGEEDFFKITLTRSGEITHKHGEQAKNQIRQPQRNKLIERILKEKLTAHDVHKESLNK